jgi:hypothetical protein
MSDISIPLCTGCHRLEYDCTCTELEFSGGNRMFTVCTENQWRAVEVFIQGLNELVEMRRTQGKSTEIVGIKTERDKFDPEGKVQTSIVRWQEVIP